MDLDRIFDMHLIKSQDNTWFLSWREDLGLGYGTSFGFAYSNESNWNEAFKTYILWRDKRDKEELDAINQVLKVL